MYSWATDFSAGAVPIGVKFCMAVRPDLGQVLSYFGGISPGMAEFWVSTGAVWWDMLLVETLICFRDFRCQYQCS